MNSSVFSDSLRTRNHDDSLNISILFMEKKRFRVMIVARDSAVDD
jgi:hypothetical protein